MHPRPEIFAALAVLAGGVAGLGNGTNEAIGGIERISAGTARLVIVNTPTNAMCLRLTVTGARSDVRMIPVGPGTDVEVELDALPVGRDAFSAEAFSVPCASFADGRAGNARGHSEPTVGFISAGDTARVAIVMIGDGAPRVVARLLRP